MFSKYGVDAALRDIEWDAIFDRAKTGMKWLWEDVITRDHTSNITHLQSARLNTTITRIDYQCVSDIVQGYCGRPLQSYEDFASCSALDQSSYIRKFVDLGIENARKNLQMQMNMIYTTNFLYVAITVAVCYDTAKMLSEAAAEHVEVKREVERISSEVVTPAVNRLQQAARDGTLAQTIKYEKIILEEAAGKYDSQAVILKGQSRAVSHRGFLHGVFGIAGIALTLVTAATIPMAAVLSVPYKMVTIGTTVASGGAAVANAAFWLRCGFAKDQIDRSVDIIEERVRKLRKDWEGWASLVQPNNNS